MSFTTCLNSTEDTYEQAEISVTRSLHLKSISQDVVSNMFAGLKLGIDKCEQKFQTLSSSPDSR